MTTASELHEGCRNAATSGRHASTHPGMSADEAALRDAVALQRKARELVHARAYEAHANGMTWAEVGEIVGMTRQHASLNYSRPPRRAM